MLQVKVHMLRWLNLFLLVSDIKKRLKWDPSTPETKITLYVNDTGIKIKT